METGPTMVKPQLVSFINGGIRFLGHLGSDYRPRDGKI